ncbi:MAG: tRNA (adenosine(37)-N6)-threonylcarbamoyltransferase complex ATPase subunit type 1 TsaE [bacterium]
MSAKNTQWSVESGSPARTQRLAAGLGALLTGGEVVGLVGDLGSGKTCFAQGLARGLAVPPEEYVRSPTFALINVHAGRVPFYHVDLYRLEDADESVYIGYDDLFDGEGVIAVEWFDRFPELWPESFLRVSLSERGDGGREVTATSVGDRPEEILRRWRAWFHDEGAPRR